MAYDENLAERLMEAVSDEPDITSRKMFGGFAVMWRGNMLAGVMGEDLMARVGPHAFDELLALPEAREMDFTGKTMKGMVIVSGSALSDEDALDEWIARAKAFVATLPAK